MEELFLSINLGLQANQSVHAHFNIDYCIKTNKTNTPEYSKRKKEVSNPAGGHFGKIYVGNFLL